MIGGNIMRSINGKNYLGPKEVAKVFDVHRRTIIRWVGQKDNSLRKIEWFLDPMSGYYFFEETQVRALLKKIVSARR